MQESGGHEDERERVSDRQGQAPGLSGAEQGR